MLAALLRAQHSAFCVPGKVARTSGLCSLVLFLSITSSLGDSAFSLPYPSGPMHLLGTACNAFQSACRAPVLVTAAKPPLNKQPE